MADSRNQPGTGHQRERERDLDTHTHTDRKKMLEIYNQIRPLGFIFRAMLWSLQWLTIGSDESGTSGCGIIVVALLV